MTLHGTTYLDALARAESFLAAEASDSRVAEEQRSFLLHHARRTPRAIVFLHGITSSPLQFRQLAELFHERGYNVFVPRMPRHGYVDRLTHDLAQLSRQELTNYTSQAIDVGRGLADHLTVAGLSVSGTLAAWAFQHRPDVDLAVSIAPAFAPYAVPMSTVESLAWLASRLPNIFVWWDPRLRGRLRSPAGYPRFATRAMAQSFELAGEVYHAAAHDPPRGQAILVITNPGDRAVSNRATRAMLKRWRRLAAAKVRHYEFGRDLGAVHDIIGPYQPAARVDHVYPILFDLIHAATA
ncbi:MAG TPA: alpha/beta fold hydrolase [Chloroflexota bacterium]|jgi:carboxylesterase|nr:alpha/beta fold hydrolase [Chloroflexota bacterium]